MLAGLLGEDRNKERGRCGGSGGRREDDARARVGEGGHVIWRFIICERVGLGIRRWLFWVKTTAGKTDGHFCGNVACSKYVPMSGTEQRNDHDHDHDEGFSR